MYKLIGSFKSRTQRVIWALEELAVPYEWVDARPGSDEVRAYNPSGKVPALLVDGELLVDSAAILNYLCDHYQSLGFEAGTIARAQQDAHMAFALEYIDGPLWAQHRTKRLTGEEPEALTKAVALWLQEGFTKLSERVSRGRYLCGEDFTVADIYTAHTLGWAKGAGHELPKEVLDYYRRCYARPAAKAMRERYS